MLFMICKCKLVVYIIFYYLLNLNIFYEIIYVFIDDENVYLDFIIN